MPARKSFARSGLLLAVTLATCRLLSFGKELFVAAQFGASSAIDAYALGLLIPAVAMAFFLNAVRRGFLVAAPRHETPDQLAAFTNTYIVQVLGMAGLLALAAHIGLPHLWPILLPVERLMPLGQELQRISTPMAWLVVPTAAVSAFTAILNARHQFARPQWTHALPTLVILVAILACGPRDGAAILAWSLFAGTSAQAILLAVMVRRAGHQFGMSPGALWKTPGGLAAVALPFLWLDAIGQANVLVDRAMAGGLPEGRLSVLYWAALGKDFLSGTVVASVLWVLLPRFSEHVASGDHAALRRSCSQVVRTAAMLLAPVSMLALLGGHLLLPLLHFGEIDARACARIGQALGGYAWGLFPELAGLALAQSLLVQARWNQLAAIGLAGLFLPNILLNWALVGPLGELGLALATSLTSCLLLLVSWWGVSRNHGIEDRRGTALSACRSILIATISGLAGWACHVGVARSLPTGAASDWMASATGVLSATALFLTMALKWPGHPDAISGLSHWISDESKRPPTDNDAPQSQRPPA